MNRKNFYLAWLVQSCLLIMGLYWLVYMWYSSPIMGFVLACVAILGLKAVLLFELTKLSFIASSNKNLMNLIYINYPIKLLLAIGIPWFYIRYYHPESTGFIVLFILIFASYLILETKILTCAAKFESV